MTCLKRYLDRDGRSVSFYSDRHGIFRVNQEDVATGEQLSQFGRSLKTLDIESIGYAMRGASVTVCEDFQGNVALLYSGKALTYETWKRGEQPPAIRDAKTLHQAVDQAIHAQTQHKDWKLAPDHPWQNPLPT